MSGADATISGSDQPLLDPTAGGGSDTALTAASISVLVNAPNSDHAATGDHSHPSVAASGGLDPSLFKVVHSKYKTGLIKTWYNVFNDVLGISIVGLPSFFNLTGVGLGPILMALFCAGTCFSLLLQRDLILDMKISSYTEMNYRAFGIGGYVYANFVIFLFNFPTVVEVLGSTLPDLLTNWFGDSIYFSRTSVVIIAVVITAPITYYKSIGRFSYFSAITSTSLAVLAVLIIGRFFATDAVHQVASHITAGGYDSAFAHSTWLRALGGISYAFTCNDLFMHAIHSLENPTPRRVATIVFGTQLTFFVLGTAVGICGYLSWFGDVNDNVLASYPASDQFNNALKLLTVIGILFFSPYNLYMPRVSILAIAQVIAPVYVTPLPDRSNKRKRLIFHIVITTSLLAMNLGVALAVSNLGAIFGFIGALSGISISLILPPLCYLRLVPNASIRKRIACVVVAGAGICGAVSCTISLIVNFA